MPLEHFHPAVARWFQRSFPAPTAAQAGAWPNIRAGRHTLVAAPTGSGKTLTAFLAAIDVLVREGVAHGGELPDETRVVYVSPLKALSNDIHINLEAPLEGIRAELAAEGLPDVAIRTAVRTGDTPQAERALMRKVSPHILVTTPESLYVLLGSASGRAMLRSTRAVIVDEIHALANSKRGTHLALSLERLESLCQRPLQRIGLSATQKPIGEVARFLVGARASAPLRGEAGGEGPRLPRSTQEQTAAGSRASPGPSSDPSGHRLPGLSSSTEEKDPSRCAIVDVGHTRRRDLAIEVPPVPLEAVMSNDTWGTVYDRLAELAREHRTTLVFVNTRRMAERAARHLAERLGREAVAAHHGSLAKELRLDAEQRLKRGELKLLVATASLELGIDIGDVDLVCQLASPRSIAAFLQRAGRSGHAVSGTPKARLFPTSRDDLLECAALLDCVRRGELDALVQPVQPLDVLAQQIVAEVACQEWDEDALYALVRGAHPYRELPREQFDAIVRMLSEGFSTRRGPRAAYIHRDAVHRQLRARRNARLTAVTSGGTIPDTADYLVVLEPQSTIVGSVNEDFAVESLAGDVFQLGNTSYRIQRVERDRLRVEDAHGAPPSIPFWLGEAPGRSDELSFGVARLREEIANLLDAGGVAAAVAWLRATLGMSEAAAQQLADYLHRAKVALGVLPTQHTIVFERFFDESGGTQLVIHTPFGSRINRAWGLALRKRFCRQFNFELQAAATEDAIVLSLSTSHSFPLEEVARYLHSNSAEHVLVQALLDAPLFPARWRWNAVTALALPRYTGGKKTPPQIQRMKSEDLLATVFPDQVACLENIVGERQIPDHPLVSQTLHDCLREAMDVDGLLRILRGFETGAIQVVARDLTGPSPLASEVLSAAPYAYLDDAPLEERRTQAVQNRRWNAEDADDLGRLDPDAIAAVREEAWPQVRSGDEMHEALTLLGFVTDDEVAGNAGWRERLDALAKHHRATRFAIASDSAPAPPRAEGWAEGSRLPGTPPKETAGLPASPGPSSDPFVATFCPEGRRVESVWVAAEVLPLWQVIHANATLHPPISAPPDYAAQPWTREDALLELVRRRLGGLGPITPAALAASLAVDPADVEPALLRLQSEGYVMQGRFTPDAPAIEWCERHLLARIHRYTIGRLRREIEPVSRRDLMRFLADWQHLTPDTRLEGPDGLIATLHQLEGYEAAAGAWESELLPSRVGDYASRWLDELCRAGRFGWNRLRAGGGSAGPVRATPIVLLPRRQMPLWSSVAAGEQTQEQLLSSRAQAVADTLASHGALFFDELLDATHLLRTELENALGELVAAGCVTADSFAGLRALLLPAAKRESRPHRRARRHALSEIEDAGRWSLARPFLLPSGGKAALKGSGEGEGLAGSFVGNSAQGRPLASILVPEGRGSKAGASRRSDPAEAEHVARVLLRRYGVVFWKLLEREAPWLPSWRELLRVYHRLEARGEIRGGRFVEGLVGEQFALPEAIGGLRGVRQREPAQQLVCVSGSDPLNLVGTVLAGDKLPALAGTRVLYEDGVPVAALVANKPQFLQQAEGATQQRWRNALLRRAGSEPHRVGLAM
ncbi:ATP-dependent helicase Lhr and Lhr-like helicase [Frateuria terrea]|uniref:ATP-dependent helicase Lhr and Lhr-like helicase n=1 Tax=Frateuria terrea TaxID=529704 RepID=A0A1H6SMD7_9GAMM|nr:DEAD/DEAH box helicase [Frateuria terrea]SEI69079.1 ATP-dependent helicase Lhr and Lhr-like helicase [Frateuria terrea]SFP27394.1 ATP-dependent helicase Lhr and Lhr-like helicase [Frateuria terrea]